MELFQQAIESMTEDMPPLAFPIGKNGREHAYLNLAKAPHALLAGTTGSGKSVGLNVAISTIMLRAKGRVRFHMIDPKRVELAHYADSDAVEAVVTDMDQAAGVIEGLVGEMDYRYELMLEAGVKNIEDYLAKTGEKMPYEILVVDELGDLMDTHSKRVLPHLIRLGQLARAAGIHMLLATQRPAADTVPKRLLANIPSRIAYRCQSHTESRLVIGEKGAEDLKGNGDLLAQIPDRQGLTRAQGPFISDEEIAEAVRLSESAEYSTGDEEIEDIDTEESIEADAQGSFGAVDWVQSKDDAQEAGRLVAEALSQARASESQKVIDEQAEHIAHLKAKADQLNSQLKIAEGDVKEATERFITAERSAHISEARMVEARERADHHTARARSAEDQIANITWWSTMAIVLVGIVASLTLVAVGSTSGSLMMAGLAFAGAIIVKTSHTTTLRRSNEQRHPSKHARAGVDR